MGSLVGAVVMYAVAAFYLYQPYLGGFSRWQYLLPINSVAAAAGCYLLSRRWVSCFAGSLLAGAVFGFGPFVLGLARFHPTAGLMAAAVAWLFLPAVFYTKNRFRWAGLALVLLPILAMLVFYQLGIRYRLFAMPISVRTQASDLGGLVAPLVMVKRTGSLVGFYHVAMAPLVIGLVMMLKARKYGIFAVFCIGVVMACCRSFYGISPLMWLVLPVLCSSVMIGEGFAGLSLAGFGDRKWVLLGAAVEGVLAIVSLLLAAKYFQVIFGLGDGYARLLVATARMYILGTVVLGLLFAITAAKMRVRWLRIGMLSLCLGADVLIGARFVVESIF